MRIPGKIINLYASGIQTKGREDSVILISVPFILAERPGRKVWRAFLI